LGLKGNICKANLQIFFIFMLKITQIRTYKANCTMSVAVLMNEERVLMTFNLLELPDRGNQRKVSCIPEGIYHIEPHQSAKFGRCFHVLDVPNRDAILIHAGNTVTDTHGCLLPGIKTSPNTVGSSKKTLDTLITKAPDGFSLQIISNQEGERGITALPPIVELIATLAPSLIDLINNIIQKKSAAKREEAIKTLLADTSLTDSEKVQLIAGII
jgi:hypothetical protein